MAKSLLSISRLTNTSPLLSPLPKPQTHRHAQNLAFISNSSSKPQAASSSDRVEFSQNLKKSARKVPRAPRRLIRISTMDGRWHGQWTSDYVVSLRELQLGDLAEDGQKDAEVLVSLSVQKHAGFGFSVDGRIVTSLTRKCSICFSSYCREINTTFNVWVLPYSRSNVDQIPEIGGNDSSVIYVKPGCEADLDSLIQDTIRLTASAKADTCSELCEKSTPRWHYVDGKDTYDRRWSRLLEIKKAL